MRARGAGRLAGLSPRRRLFVRAMTVVVVAVAGMIGAAAAGAFDGPPANLKAAQPGVVLLVPGYGGGTSALNVLAARIRGIGRTAEVVKLPGNDTGDLGVQAATLNTRVSQAVHGGVPVDVIGFSAGGVVTRLWDAQYNGAQKARLIITLGSPLNGTQVAAAGNAADPAACPVACQELVPGSTLLGRLRKAPLTRRPPWLSLWTRDDQVIRPPTSSVLAGAVNVALQSVCPNAVIVHGGLPSAPLVIGIVLRTLETGTVLAPLPGDCQALEALGSAKG